MPKKIGASQGFSLIELLAVLAIVAILAIAGVYMIGSKSGSSVRAVMDEVEGTIMAAQKLAVASGQDCLLVTQGDWAPNASAANRLILVYGVNQVPSTVYTNGLNAPESFRVAVTYNNGVASGLAREHMYAGIATANSNWWANAMTATPSGRTNPDPSNINIFAGAYTSPYTSGNIAIVGTAVSAFQGLLTQSTMNLFQGGTTLNSVIRVSGTSKRFNNTFYVEVVGLRGGAAVPGGAMGLIVGLANGANIYKFYNPGVLNGDGKWRRI